MNKQHLWLIIAQTAVLTSLKTGLADQILVELAVVPENVIPQRPEDMWHLIQEYINYSYAQGNIPEPTWYNHDWISPDW